MISHLAHRLRLCGCATGDTWHVDGRCVPIVTAQYLREQAAIEAARADKEERLRTRKAVLLGVARGEIQ